MKALEITCFPAEYDEGARGVNALDGVSMA